MSEEYNIKITADTALAITSLNEYIHTLSTVLRLLKRLGLPEEASAVITQIQKLLRIVNQLRMAYYALAIAESTTTIGMIKGAVAISSAIITSVDMMGG